VLNDSLNVDDNICRDIKCLFVRTNVLISRFRRCSKNLKLVLFRLFACVCMTWHFGDISLSLIG